MKELTEHEANLTSAKHNLQHCLRAVEELLHEKTFSQPDRDAALKEIINRANWAIDYLFRARFEGRL